MTYAAHLKDIGDILGSVRKVSALATDLANTDRLSPHQASSRRVRAALTGFLDTYVDATLAGMSDVDEARDLLRDAVNVTLDLAEAYVRNVGSDDGLLGRAGAVCAEFKPEYGGHWGLGVGDRVVQYRDAHEVFRGGEGLFKGEVVALDPDDRNRATILNDEDGREIEINCEHCVQLPTFRQRVAPVAEARPGRP